MQRPLPLVRPQDETRMNPFPFGFEALTVCAEFSENWIEGVAACLFVPLAGLPLPSVCVSSPAATAGSIYLSEVLG